MFHVVLDWKKIYKIVLEANFLKVGAVAEKKKFRLSNTASGLNFQTNSGTQRISHQNFFNFVAPCSYDMS
jgi:hypothetical protein